MVSDCVFGFQLLRLLWLFWLKGNIIHARVCMCVCVQVHNRLFFYCYFRKFCRLLRPSGLTLRMRFTDTHTGARAHTRLVQRTYLYKGKAKYVNKEEGGRALGSMGCDALFSLSLTLSSVNDTFPLCVCACDVTASHRPEPPFSLCLLYTSRCV